MVLASVVHARILPRVSWSSWALATLLLVPHTALVFAIAWRAAEDSGCSDKWA